MRFHSVKLTTTNEIDAFMQSYNSDELLTLRGFLCDAENFGDLHYIHNTYVIVLFHNVSLRKRTLKHGTFSSKHGVEF